MPSRLWSNPALAFLLASLVAVPAIATAASGTAVRVPGMVVRIDASEIVIDLGLADGLEPEQTVRLYRTIKVRHPGTGRDVVDRFLACQLATTDVASRLAILPFDAAACKHVRVGDPVEFDGPAKAAAPVGARSDAPSARPARAAETCPPVRCPACPSNAKDADGKACPPCPGNVCPPSTPCAPCPAAADARRPDELEADRVFQATLGLSPKERVDLWREFLLQHADSPLAPHVVREVDALSDWMSGSRLATDDVGRQVRAKAIARTVFHDGLPTVRVGEAAWLVFTAADWSSIGDVRVHFRRAGAGTYDLVRPEASGKLHRRVRLPTELVKPPGFEYFVAVTGASSRVGEAQEGQGARAAGDASFRLPADATLAAETTLAGTARQPAMVAVTDPYEGAEPPPKHSTTLRFVIEYIDFNRFRKDDQVAFVEADATYRLRDTGPLYAFRVGYGVISGGGGKVAEANSDLLHLSGPKIGMRIDKDDTIEPRVAHFKYSYVETEWAALPTFHVLTRLFLGLDKNGLALGMGLLGRIGPERGTNLKIGANSVADIGQTGLVSLTTHVIERIPMSGIFEVTNRPVAEDVAVRLVYEADLLLTDTVGVTLRIGYNLRTIEHAGLSAGGGLAFHW